MGEFRLLLQMQWVQFDADGEHCWALEEVCTLLSAITAAYAHATTRQSHKHKCRECKFACRCRCEAQLSVLEVKHTFAPFDCGSDFTGQSSPKRNSQSQDVDLLFALSCAYIGRELEVDLGAEWRKHKQLESSPNLSGASWRSHKVCFYMNTINMMIDGLQGYMWWMSGRGAINSSNSV